MVVLTTSSMVVITSFILNIPLCLNVFILKRMTSFFSPFNFQIIYTKGDTKQNKKKTPFFSYVLLV